MKTNHRSQECCATCCHVFATNMGETLFCNEDDSAKDCYIPFIGNIKMSEELFEKLVEWEDERRVYCPDICDDWATDITVDE
jgi:hypothetical protein